MMRKWLAGGLVITMAAALAACSSSTTETTAAQTTAAQAAESAETKTEDGKTEAAQSNWPEKSITLLCPWSAGGGSDLTVRTLAPYLEEALGTSITVVNETGAGGWIAWEELVKAEPDGYTIAQMNLPAMVSGYLDKNQQHDYTLDNFTPLSNQVSDWGTITVRADDDRFPDIDTFMEYAKENELLASDSGQGGNKHMVTEQMNAMFGTKFVAVHQSGSSESYAALLGGHVDVIWPSIGECLQGYQDGEVRVLAVLAPERSKLLGDVPTLQECGYEELDSPADRGYVGPAGIPEEILKVYDEAFDKAINNPEFIEKMEELGQEVNYMDRATVTEYIKDMEPTLKEYADVMGWDME